MKAYFVFTFRVILAVCVFAMFAYNVATFKAPDSVLAISQENIDGRDYNRTLTSAYNPEPGSYQSRTKGVLSVKETNLASHYVKMYFDDLNATWTAWFKANGMSEPTVGYILIREGKPFRSKCFIDLVKASTNNAFYCGADTWMRPGGRYRGMILLPSVTMTKLLKGDVFGRSDKTDGVYATATIVAHEYAHHVTDLLKTQSFSGRPPGHFAELIADCFASNWVKNMVDRHNFDNGAFQATTAVLRVIAAPSKKATRTHGNAPERDQAMRIGFSGSPGSCIKTYWPDFHS